MHITLNPGPAQAAGTRSKVALAWGRASMAWARVKDRAAHVARLAVVAPMAFLSTNTVFAGLPRMPVPGTDMNGDDVQDGDWLGYMSAYYKVGIAIIGLVLAGLAFIYVMMGAMEKWKSYGSGRAQVADLKEYMIAGAVLVAFIVMMATYALSTTGNAVT